MYAFQKIVNFVITHPEKITGVGIVAINLVNIRCKKEHSSMFHIYKYSTVSIIKGYIYYVFYPISLLGICGSTLVGTKKDFDYHFIPCSKYFDEEPKSNESSMKVCRKVRTTGKRQEKNVESSLPEQKADDVEQVVDQTSEQ